MDKKLVAYITTGFEDREFTIDLALSLTQHGVDTVELGVPFSDPVADGAVIERANHIALERGFRFKDVLDVTQAIASDVDTLLMGYFNPFYQYGVDNLLAKLASCGASGLIVPDLPFEEASLYTDLFKKYDLANICFVAPTDSDERIKTIVKETRKFIYLVAYAGITGSSKQESLSDTIESIRSYSNTPIYVGFGVNESSAKEKVRGVDGVIVGSAFISILLRDDLSLVQKIDECSKVAQKIKSQINS